MSQFFLVDIKDIKSPESRSKYPPDLIENIAQTILQSGGLLKPLILHQTGPESYEIIDNYLEFYGALRAYEINPRAAETVNAFVIPKKHADQAHEQLKLLTLSPMPSPIVDGQNLSGLEMRFNNFELRIEQAIKDAKNAHDTDLKRLESKIQEMEKLLPKKVDALQMFNNFEEHELVLKFCSAKIGNSTANKLASTICEVRKKAAFTSFTDVVNRVKGLGDKTMLRILDVCAGLS